MSTENKKESCLQRDSAEREEYAGALKSMQERAVHSAGYGRKGTVQSRNFLRRYWTEET